MTAILFLLHALVAGGLILLILLQRADTGVGGAFGGGSGGAQPVIRNPLAKPTAILAGVFLATSLLIAYTQQGAGHGGSVIEVAPELPVTLDGVNGSSLPMPELPAAAVEASTSVPVEIPAGEPVGIPAPELPTPESVPVAQ